MKIIMLLAMLMSDVRPGTEPRTEIVLLDFTAGYCQPCQQMLPILQRMERDGFPIEPIDISKKPELVKRFAVDRIPTFILLVEGKEVDRFVGLTSEAELRREMNNAARELAEARRAATVPNDAQSGRVLPTANNSESQSPAKPTQAESSPRRVRDVIGCFQSRNGWPTGLQDTNPTLRAQSPEPDRSQLTGLAAPSAATVRIHVTGVSTKDGREIRDVGTGTVVYSSQTEAVVLTCAHLFLNVAIDSSEVKVDVFIDGTVTSYEARIIGGDHDSDLAFLRIPTPDRLPSIALARREPEVKRNQILVSYGCNEGANPSRLDMQLVDINRYNGPGNLVCTTDPESGRSGGGLFNANGELVGVCSCADRDQNEGLYMAYAPILSLLERLKLNSILQATPVGHGEDAPEMFLDLLEGKTDSLADNRQKTTVGVTNQKADVADIGPSSFDDDNLQPTSETVRTEVAWHEDEVLSDASPFLTADAGTASPQDLSLQSRTIDSIPAIGPKVTVTIEDRTAGSQAKVIVIPQASLWLLELLTGESQVEPDLSHSKPHLRHVVTSRE